MMGNVLIFVEILIITVLCTLTIAVIGLMVYAACEFIRYLRRR